MSHVLLKHILVTLSEEILPPTISQGMHTDGINGIRYLSHNKTVVTSSRDPQASIIIMHIANKLDSYVFKLAWGVRCFDLRQEV